MSLLQAPEEETAAHEPMIALGRLQSPLAFGRGFTESFAIAVNKVVRAFNSRPAEDRSRIYGDFTAAYDKDRVKRALEELIDGLELNQFNSDMGLITLRNYFIGHAVPPAEGQVLVVKVVDLLAAS